MIVEKTHSLSKKNTSTHPKDRFSGNEHTDIEICHRLDVLATNADYWDFRCGAKRDAIHGVSQYPAMMVPAMQGKLLDVLCDVMGSNIHIMDPFIGSGTTLVEAMRRGIHFHGQDVNPLAVLISRSKTGPFNIVMLKDAVKSVCKTASSDRRRKIDVNFPTRDKWFNQKVARDLSRLRRAIIEQNNLWVRRMLWVSLAETVRLTSNSRTSTFKLHIRSNDDLASRRVDAISEFHTIATDAAMRATQEIEKLTTAGLLDEGAYSKIANVDIGRSDQSIPGTEMFDLLITSPPYGDGTTTVPYGQYSYLPLQWIDRSDIAESADEFFLNSTHEIDSRSLGGSQQNAIARVEPLLHQSPTLAKYLSALKDHPRDRSMRVAAFFADFAPVLDTIVARMRPCGYMIWTVGNRRVGGIPQPLDEILSELLKQRGCIQVTKLERTIPSKRMASRNSISQTMRQEHVLLMRRGCEK